MSNNTTQQSLEVQTDSGAGVAPESAPAMLKTADTTGPPDISGEFSPTANQQTSATLSQTEILDGLAIDPNSPFIGPPGVESQPKAMNRIYLKNDGESEVVIVQNTESGTSENTEITPPAEANINVFPVNGNPVSDSILTIQTVEYQKSPDGVSPSPADETSPEQNVDGGLPPPSTQAETEATPVLPAVLSETNVTEENPLEEKVKILENVSTDTSIEVKNAGGSHNELFSETNPISTETSLKNSTEEEIKNELSVLENQKSDDQDKQKRKFFKELYSRRSLFRHLSVFASLVVGVFLLGITLFIGGSMEESQPTQKNKLHSTGSNRISLISGETFFVKGSFPLFGGENIEAVDENTEIHFAEGSIVRMKKGSVVKVDQLFPVPVIRLETGEIWVLGNRNLEVLFEKARFEARSVSARFQKEDHKVTASSYRHPLFVEIWAEDKAKYVFFAIPKEKRVIFFENSIPQTIASLHFSKLKKEIRFSDAEKDDWVSSNLIEDNAQITKYIEELRLKKKGHYLGEDLLASIQKSLILFPDKKKKEAMESLVRKQQSYLVDYVNDGVSFALTPAELSQNTLDEVIVLGNSLPPSKNIIETADTLYQEVEKRKLSGKPEHLIAHNQLSLFEDALSTGKTDLMGSTLDKMAKRWDKKKLTHENRNLLEVYREIIADLSRRYLNLITPEILIASNRLDLIAISWDSQQMSVITTLEVAEKNLTTADTFLEKSKLNMAKILLDINDTLLQIKPTTDLVAGYESIRSRQEFLKEKYTVFKSNGWMSKEDLFTLIAKRENAEKIILYVQDEKIRLARLSAPVETQKTLSETIRESFAENKIQIISMIGADGKDVKVVEIIEARMPDGEIFSGEYLPDYKVIRNVKLEDNREIKNDVQLAQLISTIEALRTNQYLSSGEDLRQLRTNPIPELEKDPLEKMDTLDIEVMKLLAQASLSEKQFTVELKDIIIKSPKTVRLKNVTFDEIKGHTLELDFNTETREVGDVILLPENMSVMANTLEQLVEAAIVSIEKYEENMELIKQVKWILINSGIAIEDDNIRYTPSGIHFENAIFHDWKLSGLADARSSTFLMIMRSGKPFLTNITFDKMKEVMEKKWQEEEKIRRSIN